MCVCVFVFVCCVCVCVCFECVCGVCVVCCLMQEYYMETLVVSLFHLFSRSDPLLLYTTFSCLFRIT